MNGLGIIQTTRDMTASQQDPDPILRNNLGFLNGYEFYNPFHIDNMGVSFNGYHLDSRLYTNDEGEGLKVGPQVRYDSENGVSARVAARFDI